MQKGLTSTFAGLPHLGLALCGEKQEDLLRTGICRYEQVEQSIKRRRNDKKKPQRGGSVLTVFGASDVGQDPEALGLQVGGTASPFRHVLGLSWPDHRLVNWGRTVHHGVLDRQSSAAGQTGLLRAVRGVLGDAVFIS